MNLIKTMSISNSGFLQIYFERKPETSLLLSNPVKLIIEDEVNETPDKLTIDFTYSSDKIFL